jgi:N-acetylmuramoyl-L-alanine amidase
MWHAGRTVEQTTPIPAATIENMSFARKSLPPVLFLLGFAGGWWSRPIPSTPPVPAAEIPESPPTSAASPPAHLAPLGDEPDWAILDSYQKTITRGEFERLLATVFTTGEAWKNFIALDDHQAVITPGAANSGLRFHLQFAATGQEKTPPRHWRTTAELPPAPADRPLEGLRIAIDPGHIGGAWAKMEERWFVVGDGKPVCEGDLTLAVARLLKPRLEALGAVVSLVRNDSEPLTPLRPESLLEQAAMEGKQSDTRKLAERLFYRTAEIRARAELVNQSIKPDLVLCLHFNAEPWGDPKTPNLVDRTHFHLLLNGGYTDDELALTDQRFEMLRKLLQRTHGQEAAIGTSVAAAFYQAAGLPPYSYAPDTRNARTVDGNPFLWARNLLANRLYDCPVLFLEPYVMNSQSDYARIQAGDYEGQREVAGKMQPSIFREYANAVTEGLAEYYLAHRARLEAN